MALMNVSSNVIGPIFEFLIQHPTENANHNTIKCFEAVDDPTVEPTPSEKHFKREVLNIVGLQMISRDTPFL